MDGNAKEQPNSMDEPGGPEAPLPGEENENGSASKRKVEDGAATDPDFVPPVVPGNAKNSVRK